MKSTRERILQTLLNNPQSTINDLAEAVDINSISVRHHLSNLQVDGLVHAQEERHGVGRPRLVYSLTESGIEKFPTRYLNLTNRLLSHLKTVLSQKEIERIFIQMAKQIAAVHMKSIQKLSFEGKLDFIKKTLADEGFVVEWEKSGEDYLINEISCPFYHIGLTHPEVCSLDQTLISTMLSIPTEKINCVLSGDNHCTYIIRQKI